MTSSRLQPSMADSKMAMVSLSKIDQVNAGDRMLRMSSDPSRGGSDICWSAMSSSQVGLLKQPLSGPDLRRRTSQTLSHKHLMPRQRNNIRQKTRGPLSKNSICIAEPPAPGTSMTRPVSSKCTKGWPRNSGRGECAHGGRETGSRGLQCDAEMEKQDGRVSGCSAIIATAILGADGRGPAAQTPGKQASENASKH